MNKIIYSFLALFFFVSCQDFPARGDTVEAKAHLVTCSAQVFCPQTGRFAHCAVYANPFMGQRCTWEAYPAYGVRCRGWDLFGNWIVYEDYCLRW